MDSGMLWFCPRDSRPLLNHVEEAALFYASKYGAVPAVCQVHPHAAETLPARLVLSSHAATVRIVSNKTVLRGHLWLGGDATP